MRTLNEQLKQVSDSANNVAHGVISLFKTDTEIHGVAREKSIRHSISFSGGAIAEYVLLGADGIIKNAGVVQRYGNRLEESEFTKAAAKGTLCAAEAGGGEKGKANGNHRP